MKRGREGGRKRGREKGHVKEQEQFNTFIYMYL